MVKKYGIQYQPTKEWVVCTNDEKDYLFTADETKIKAALTNILYADGGYDGDEKDFKILPIDLPEDYDGSSLVDGEDIYFVDPQIVDANLVMKDVFKDYGLNNKK